MTALAHEAPRAVRFSPVCFYAYRITESGRTYPLIVDCSTLQEAIDGAKVQCQHKDHLLIREVSDQADKHHLFAIKRKSAPRYVYKDYQTTRVHDLYAAPVCSFDGRIIAAAGDEYLRRFG